MARNYSEEEKAKKLLDKYKVSGKSKTTYARENGIPEATFRAWVKRRTIWNVWSNRNKPARINITKKTIVKSTIFCNDNI